MKFTKLYKRLIGVWGILKRFYAWVPPRRAAPVAGGLKFSFMLLTVGLFIYLFGAWILNLLVAAIIVVGGLVLVVLGVVGQATKPKKFSMSSGLYNDVSSPNGYDAFGNPVECGQSSKRSYY